jgi:hypothetical protein
MGGKEILLKAVKQAIPTYVMHVFNILRNICKGITDAISQFWWGDNGNDKKMHWSPGGKYVFLRIEEDWDFKILTVLTLQCWLNRCGA